MGRHSVLRVRWCVLRRAFSDAESGVKAGTNGTTIKRYWLPMILYTGGIGSRLPFGFFFFATTEYPFWKRSGVFVARERVVNRFSFFLAFFFVFLISTVGVTVDILRFARADSGLVFAYD